MRQYREFPFKDDKFRELIVHIARECEDDPTFGATKLNKILYYSDFYAYRVLGQPITGATYQKLSEGPAPREFLRQRAILEDAGDIAVEQRAYFNGVQKRVVVLGRRKANTRLFTKDELSLVNEVIRFFSGKTAKEVSDFSHAEPGWQTAEYGEAIPYETAWIGPNVLDAETEIKILESG